MRINTALTHTKDREQMVNEQGLARQMMKGNHGEAQSIHEDSPAKKDISKNQVTHFIHRGNNTRVALKNIKIGTQAQVRRNRMQTLRGGEQNEPT